MAHPSPCRPRGLLAFLLTGTLAAALAPTPARCQIPETFQDLQVLPADISRAALIDTMRQFAFALDVRCHHCHVQRGDSFRDMDFAADHPLKDTARRMVRMTRALELEWLQFVEHRAEPPVRVSCKTCHRGQALPRLLSEQLWLAAEAAGADSAARRYRALRQTEYAGGAYDFGEWETNAVAERLADAGRTAEAIALYELNAEFHPESAAIWSALGGLHEARADTQQAVAAYERVIELGSRAHRVQARLDALRGAER